jgi:D-glycero-alpha-D-manno-heptose-7-phosphate kinase
MVDLVWVAREALYDGELRRFGELLNLSWNMKRQVASKITNPEIDRMYQAGLEAGAVGGKLLGAGGGGFLLFYAEPAVHGKLREALAEYRELDFKFDRDGARVIYAGD